MEERVSYLFGAGASCNALPTVNEIPQGLAKFRMEIDISSLALSDKETYKNLNLSESKRALQLEFFKTIDWLEEGCHQHASIDIFAKKLYVTGKTADYIRLKSGLTCYFIYTQIKNSIDKRYDSFLAALIDADKSINNLPANLSILSWNYDFQFEKAYSAYTGSNSLSDNQTRLNVIPSDLGGMTGLNAFAIFKLNGTTSANNVQWNNIQNIIDKLDHEINVDFMNSLVESYVGFTRFHMQFRPMLSFSWEKKGVPKDVIKMALGATKETKVLTIIGYSFPFFNRDVDREIIRNMKGLETVYFQAPGQEAYKYVDRFKAIRKDANSLNLIPIEDTDQFFLPPEL